MSENESADLKDKEQLKAKILELENELSDMNWVVSTTNKEVKVLYEQLKKWNETLEQKVDERTQELRESQAQLVQSEKLSALGELSAGIAHELNQPLNGIKIIAQSVKKDIEKNRFSKEALPDDIKEIVGLVNKMAEIIDHMRIYSRRSDNLPKKMVDINEVVVSPLKIIGQQIKVHDIEVIQELAENLPQVVANPIALEQVFMNLIGNARNALEDIEKEEKQIVIKTYTQTADSSPIEKDSVIIQIKDNGQGIAEDIQAKIFQPFFTTKEVGKGTGLGLSISHKIIAEHQGIIQVQSKMGQGTVFTIALPAAV